MDRIATLQSFIARSPDDPFARYGLAMALKGHGRIDDAVREFAALMERFPDYVPTYLMAGTTLAEAGRRSEAHDILTRGLAAAQQKGDHHAASELASALAALP